MVRRLLLLSGLFLASGCTWPVRQNTDDVVCHLADHPFDVAPEPAPEAAKPPEEAHEPNSTPLSSRSGKKTAPAPEVPIDAHATAWMESPTGPARRDAPLKDDHVLAAAWTEPQPEPSPAGAAQLERDLASQRKLDVSIPPRLPGSEAPRLELRAESDAAKQREIQRIYPELEPLPVQPKVQPGPKGKPYTLADLQGLAAANSPTLRQAAADVEAAKGILIQAKTYPNPIFSYLVDPSNNNSTAGVQGAAIEQIIITGGKQKLGVAAAQKDLDNAILALKRARSDLSTAVRNAYFTVLVDVETLVVTQAVAQFSDDIYRLQTAYVRAGQPTAAYEPTALRAQTYINRLAYKQAIASYIYDWKALVATLGLPQLPLSEIAGQVDRFIPYYDYDEVRAHVLQNHTDVLTARNTVKKSQYLLKAAQVTPYPNLDVRYSLEKDFSLGPFGTYQTLALGIPLPIWDVNKGNIIAAQGALLRAGEESHRVEVTLTNSLALAYEGYRNNLYAMEYYRRNILPDLVRYYRGVFARRQVDATSPFGDLVFAQQNLTTNVTAYIGILGALWTSVVGVADFLQTDDLFQLAKPRELPELPDFKQLPHWACGHAGVAAPCANRALVRDPGIEAYGAGPPVSGLAVGVPAQSAQSGTGTPLKGAGVRPAPPPPSQGVQPPAGPRPAAPTDRPPAPPSGPNGDGTARIDRRRDPGIGPVALMNSYFGNEEHRGGQAFVSPTALVQPSFGKVESRVCPAFLAPVQSYFGEEKNHEGQNF